MKDYKKYLAKFESAEDREEKASGTAENIIPLLFLFVGAAVSAGATYYLGERGMRASPFYARTIGADNAAILNTIITEGTFLALTLGHFILKSKPQREIGRFGLIVTKCVLSLNVIVAFVMLAGFESVILPAVEIYAQWGVPITLVGAIWLWAHIVTNRRKTIMRNAMLDRSAIIEEIWAEQHREDQEKYRHAYKAIADSPEMDSLRSGIARRRVVEEIARQANITTDEAEHFIAEIESRKALPSAGHSSPAGHPQRINGQTSWNGGSKNP